ncbi:MAG TPA: hypothetical protein PLE54_07790, partial [Burkholderiaceae bacterium]|nr:hypothetical protein [Burkholderiaceae bacterium]HQR70488.1 hypothetical protein [Burkholderiaceae bacterium]
YDNLGRARNEHVWLADRPIALIVYAFSGSGTTPTSTPMNAPIPWRPGCNTATGTSLTKASPVPPQCPDSKRQATTS